jgi:ferredoxin
VNEVQALRIAIIGTGPAGLACLKTIVQLNKEKSEKIEITWYDIGKTYNEENKSKLENSTALKSYFGDAYSYDQNEYTKIAKGPGSPNLWPSAGRGGFSRVWGATLIGETDADFFDGYVENMGLESKLLTEGGKQILSRFANLNERDRKNFQILPLKMAVKADLCTKCGQCLIGCPQNAIWCATDGTVESEKIVHRNSEFVKSIEIGREGLLTLISKNHVDQFNKVFIAAGPISSAAILFNSGLINEACYLRDSQTIFNLFFHKRYTKTTERFALAQSSFNLRMKNRLVSNIQIYPCGETLIDHLSSIKILKKIPRSFIFFLSQYLAAGIAYLPPENSGKIRLEKNKTGEFSIQVEKPDGRLRILLEYFKSSFNCLRKIGMWQIPFIKLAGIGEGYHFGNLYSLSDSNMIKNLASEGIYIVGAAALIELPTGPITDHLIKDTIKRTHDAFRVY